MNPDPWLLLPAAAPPPQARRWAAPRPPTSSNTEKLLSRPTALSLQETLGEGVYVGRPLAHRILPWAGGGRVGGAGGVLPGGPFLKPAVLCLGLCGKQSWKPWLVSGLLELSRYRLRPGLRLRPRLRLRPSLCRQFCAPERGQVPERVRAGGAAEEELPAALLPAPLALLRQVLAVGVLVLVPAPVPSQDAARLRLAQPPRVCVRRGKILFLLRLLADHVPGLGLVARELCAARTCGRVLGADGPDPLPPGPLMDYLPTWQKVYFYNWG